MSIFVEDSVRIIVNKSQKDAVIIHDRVKKSMRMQWGVFIFLQYVNENDGNIEDIPIEYKKKQNIRYAINRLYKNNIFSYDNHKRKFESAIEYVQFNLLSTIQIEVTTLCNFYCKHCYLPNIRIKKNELSYIELTNLIDSAQELGIMKVCLTGGEPLVRNDIYDVMDYLQQKNLETELFTNGYLLNKKICDVLKKVKISKVRISMDGYNSKSHDMFRGKQGSFNHNIGMIRYLKEIDVPVAINCVLHRGNITDIEEMQTLFEKKLKVEYKFDYLIESGNAVTNLDEIGITINDYANTLYRVINNKLDNNQMSLETAGNRFCDVGRGFAYITATGNVKLCPSLNDKFTYGSVRRKTLKEIWTNNFDKYVDLNCCKHDVCEFYNVCCGVCRSRAFIINHDINAPDTVLCKVLEYLKRGE